MTHRLNAAAASTRPLPRGGLAIATTALLAAAALWLCASASAAAPPPLTQVPEDGVPGSSAGRLDFPGGIAADQNVPGHLYVVDRFNARIDELSAWGAFVKAWGWGVRDGEAELQTCTEASGCQVGLEGAEAGEFNTVEGIAVDGAGDVYVVEAQNHRIQQFRPNGPEEAAQFVATFGLDVDKTKVEEGAPEAERNLCTAASGDECQAGTAGSGPGQLGGAKFSYLQPPRREPRDRLGLPRRRRTDPALLDRRGLRRRDRRRLPGLQDPAGAGRRRFR